MEPGRVVGAALLLLLVPVLVVWEGFEVGSTRMEDGIQLLVLDSSGVLVVAGSAVVVGSTVVVGRATEVVGTLVVSWVGVGVGTPEPIPDDWGVGMIPTEVAVAGAVVPETVKGIDGWGTPLEAGTPGVGIRPIPPVEVVVGRSEPRPLVRPPTMEPSRSSVLLAVGLPVGDTAGTLTGMVEDPVGVVLVSAAGMEMPRLSRRLPWEEVVVATAVDDFFESLESVAAAVELVFVAVAPRRPERPEPTVSRRESLVVVAASDVAVLAAALLALELALEPLAVEVALAALVVLVPPRPSKLETSEPTWLRRPLLEVAAAVLDWTVVLVVVGFAAETTSVVVVRV
jgi:hypothetical protein